MNQRMRAVIVAALGVSSRLASAETATTVAEPAPGVGLAPGLLQATLGLAAVLALIWGAAWLIRRVAPMTGHQHSAIKVIATQSVGQRERVVLVEIGDQWLVLGVAPGQVSALQALPKSALPAAEPLHPFNRLLALAKARREA